LEENTNLRGFKEISSWTERGLRICDKVAKWIKLAGNREGYPLEEIIIREGKAGGYS
jgi:hypothetical protein